MSEIKQYIMNMNIKNIKNIIILFNMCIQCIEFNVWDFSVPIDQSLIYIAHRFYIQFIFIPVDRQLRPDCHQMSGTQQMRLIWSLVTP